MANVSIAVVIGFPFMYLRSSNPTKDYDRWLTCQL